MSLLLQLATGSRKLLATALVASVLSGLIPPLLVVLINRSLEASRAELPILGLQFAGLSALMLALRWLGEARFVELRHATMARLRSHISRQFANLEFTQLEARGAAAPLAVLIEDIATVSGFFVALPQLLIQGAIVVGCLTYLAVLSWQAFAFALAVLVFGTFGTNWGRQRATAYLRGARAGEDELYEHFRALFAGAKELRLHSRRRFEFLSRALGASVESIRRQFTRGLSIHVAASSLGSFLFFFAIGGVVFGLSALLGADSQVRSGYALMLLYMMHPMELLLEAIPEIAQTRIALESIREQGVASSELVPPAPSDALPPRVESVRLRGVTHCYGRDTDDGIFVLGPIDLELQPGEVVFLIGGNGSGKTTLAKLVVGLYAPEAGHILLNGVSVEAADREAYRQCFSAVFSDFHLFDRLLGLDARELDGRARVLLERLDLSHKLSVVDGKFSTTELSQGQRKRLALLVACLEDRPVYVFDEWAADQDPAYRHTFYHELLPELRAAGKVLLVISHDDQYFHLADRCIRLENGRLGLHELTPPDSAARGRATSAIMTRGEHA